MHYKNGREAKNGDKVVLFDSQGNIECVGVLYDAVAGNDYCNGRLAAIGRPNQPDPFPNLKECLHIKDVQKAVAEFKES